MLVYDPGTCTGSFQISYNNSLALSPRTLELVQAVLTCFIMLLSVRRQLIKLEIINEFNLLPSAKLSELLCPLCADAASHSVT